LYSASGVSAAIVQRIRRLHTQYGPQCGNYSRQPAHVSGRCGCTPALLTRLPLFPSMMICRVLHAQRQMVYSNHGTRTPHAQTPISRTESNRFISISFARVHKPPAHAMQHSSQILFPVVCTHVVCQLRVSLCAVCPPHGGMLASWFLVSIKQRKPSSSYLSDYDVCELSVCTFSCAHIPCPSLSFSRTLSLPPFPTLILLRRLHDSKRTP